ncbi:unnamed protein product [Miscanthus lutarioriparius]|uniref:Transcription repressor n=1 Tax=Miscanthus lutarioriparius TaxID=422564 RepID=A0A811REN2_9POAL|nr:unnamed protein product [Miscanthus lutarioriparius]
MSSASASRARRGGSLQFPVGRSWRHVAVVDAGCGCRPRRATTRLLSQLPSFLRPSPKPPQQPPRSSSRSSSGFFPSSASTASSAASAATFTTTHSSYSNYSAYSYNYNPAAAAAAVTKHPPASKAPAEVATSRRRQQQGGHQGRRKKRYEKMAAAAAPAAEAAAGEDGGDVGVAVEKESSDPRADFRESMVQMVVEMGLCGWDDLRCMLRRLLALNAPRHHAAILAAFAEVCAQLTAPPPPQPAYHAYDYHYHY